MKNIWNKYWVLFFLIVCITISVVSVLKSNQEIKNVKKNAKYNIAYITSNWHQKNNRGAGTDFKYYVNGRTISKTCNYNLQKGTKYLIMYDSISPSRYIMLGHHQLPDDIEVPSNGWKFNEIPISIDSADLKQYFKKLGID